MSQPFRNLSLAICLFRIRSGIDSITGDGAEQLTFPGSAANANCALRTLGPHKILYSFTDTNENGAVPFTTLVMDKAGIFYGTSQGGIGPCNGGCGVIFKLSPGSNGKWKYTVLHRFTDATNDGAEPFSGLVFDKTEKHLYGTTAFGGTYNFGVAFEITP